MFARDEETTLEALAELREWLRGGLESLETERSGLEEERSGLDQKLEALIEKIESKRRQLELVEATEEQLAAQERDQRALQGKGPGASTQVRG
jgi:phage shock protein A